VGEGDAQRPSGRRLTVDEAARHLGLTVDAVRKRIQRGQIPHERDAAGRVRIILDEGETLQDEGQDITGPGPALVEELRDRIAFLEGQLQGREEEIRRRDAILMNMTEAMKALGPPREPSEEPSQSAEPGPTASTPPDVGEGQEAASERPDSEAPRSWWRRMFGGGADLSLPSASTKSRAVGR
jgi:excisionase family DNA binding protein